VPRLLQSAYHCGFSNFIGLQLLSKKSLQLTYRNRVFVLIGPRVLLAYHLRADVQDEPV
jgi:hypothetical protein